MSRRHRKRKIIITVEVRNPDDAKRIADAIQATLDAANTTRPVEQVAPEAPVESDSTPAVVGNCEQVETEASNRAGSHLESKSEKIARANSEEGKLPDARNPESPEKVIAQRANFMSWVRAAGATGYRITLKVVVDVVEEIIKRL